MTRFWFSLCLALASSLSALAQSADADCQQRLYAYQSQRAACDNLYQQRRLLKSRIDWERFQKDLLWKRCWEEGDDQACRMLNHFDPTLSTMKEEYRILTQTRCETPQVPRGCQGVILTQKPPAQNMNPTPQTPQKDSTPFGNKASLVSSDGRQQPSPRLNPPLPAQRSSDIRPAFGDAQHNSRAPGGTGVPRGGATSSTATNSAPSPRTSQPSLPAVKQQR